MAMTQKLFTLKTDLPILNVTSFAVSFVSFFQVATLSTGIEFGQRQTKPRLGDNENDGNGCHSFHYDYT